MKQSFLLFFMALLPIFCLKTQAQKKQPVAKITLIETRNNQKGSVPTKINVLQKNSIAIPYDQNYILFRFINTTDSTQKSFEYKLLGLDYEWIKCNDCSEVRYAHLDGGAYTFQIKTLDSNTPVAEFAFSIDQNIWYKWWFIPMLFFYFLVLFGVGAYFYGLLKLREKLQHQRHIHQEKMKSMSELTSGIAHEIQNPLNFVNNFSELSIELGQELKEEVEKIDFDKELVSELVSDLLQNQEKIFKHGQRASGIVKGMLEHSRANIGEFQLTDLNKLIEEQLQISYHNFGVKYKDFYAEYEFNATAKLPKINLIPQEVGKMLLNIFDNAFYAVNEKKRGGVVEEEKYLSKVVISVECIDNQVIIKVYDNGIGMPENVRAKIFQPFFTTKPTGQGTGLGLSLAYDIVTKGHGGTLEVETKEGVGTTFIIKIPYI